MRFLLCGTSGSPVSRGFGAELRGLAAGRQHAVLELQVVAAASDELRGPQREKSAAVLSQGNSVVVVQGPCVSLLFV